MTDVFELPILKMGLDVVSHSLARFEHPLTDHHWDTCADRNLHPVIAAPGFEDHLDGLVEGCYRVANSTGLTMHIIAGSYSGYGVRRNRLSLIALGVEATEVWADPDKYRGRPCFELINFSDCEGTIGPTTSAKLAADLTTLLPVLDKDSDPLDSGPLLPPGYWENWVKLFEIAAQDGFVCFH